MPDIHGAEPLTAYSTTDVGRLRSALWSAGYNADGVGAALGSDEATSVPPPSQLPVVRRQLPAGKPLSTLIELFLLGLGTSRDRAAAALKPSRSTQRRTTLRCLIWTLVILTGCS